MKCQYCNAPVVRTLDRKHTCFKCKTLRKKVTPKTKKKVHERNSFLVWQQDHRHPFPQASD